MKNNTHLFIIIISLVVLLGGISCKEKQLRTLKDKGDAAPGVVSNEQVENLPGAAKISYDLPESESLLYIKAVYHPRAGVKREVKATYYKNSLLVDGFAEAKAYEVELYAVSRGGNASAMTTVTVNPLTPPFVRILNSIRMEAAFGGVHLDFENKFEANVAIAVITKDSLGQYNPIQIEYTDQKEGGFSIRGLDPIKRKFGYYVRDQFQNISDTLYIDLTPLYEVKLDQHKFSNAKLPNDSWKASFGNFADIWDDKIGNQSSFFTSEPTGLPQWCTINLGQKARISRFLMCGRPHWASYNRSYPKVFELWGSVDPNPNGAFDSTWFKFGTFVSVPPSGEDPPTEDDIEHPTLPGENFTIPNAQNFPAVKYIRIKVLESWGGLPQYQIGDIDVYGQLQ